MVLLPILLVILAICVLILSYLKIWKPLKYWEDKGIPFAKPYPIFGNVGPIVFRTQALADLLRDVYAQFPNKRYFGFYQFSMPTLILRDPDLVKQLFTANFEVFADRKEFLPENCDQMWSKNLFASTGKRWHELRSVLSPAFTSSKIKSMYLSMTEIAHRFVDHLGQLQKGNNIVTLELNDFFSRFTNDVIAEIAFGIKCDSLEERNNEFFELGTKAFDYGGLKSLKFFGFAISSTLMQLLNVQFFDGRMKSFFHDIVRQTIKDREAKKLNTRQDMIQLLRMAQKGQFEENNSNNESNRGCQKLKGGKQNGKLKAYKNINITDEDLTAQALLFYFGGFEAVARLMCHMAHELAANPEVQERLIKEVDMTLKECSGQVPYDAIQDMKYLDTVASETLRLWSSGVVINRKASKSFIIEPKLPGEKPLHVEAGTACMVPICAIHRDPKYFPEPNKFNPDRFSKENKHKIKSYTYIPFGVGPRNCIASRLGLLEAKIIIFLLLTRFEIVPVEKTEIPFTLSKKSVLISSDAGYWLGLKSRK